MKVVLLRHARAGKRADWTGDDRLRGLDESGWRQASGLVVPLAALGVDRLVSSPFTRCVQTLEPLAASLGAEIEKREELSEGATGEAVRRLFDDVAGSRPALCTHGDVVKELVGAGLGLKKGAARVLDIDDGKLRLGAEMPPQG